MIMSWASVLMASPVATLGSQFCFHGNIEERGSLH